MKRRSFLKFFVTAVPMLNLKRNSFPKGKEIDIREKLFDTPKGGETVSIFLVESYVVKAEKRAEFTLLLNEFLKYKKDHPQLFSGVKSWKLYKQDYGGISGMYIEMWEYEGLVDMEKINKRIFEDKEMKRINEEFHALVEPAAFSSNIWSPVA
jgi:hypothetical protein